MLSPRSTGPVTALTAHDALERHLALVQLDGLGLEYNRISDRLVYHYTDLAGLRGIIESEGVWASDYRFLNDRTEFTFGLEILEMVLAYGEGTETWSEDLRQRVLISIAMMIRGHGTWYVLSASFCRKGNVLSQWRAYGRRDGAIAIGFDLKHLMERACEQAFVCGRVHYYWAEAYGRPEDERFSSWLRERCRELPTRLEQAAQLELGSEDETLGEEVRERLISGRQTSAIERWIAEVAAFIKHPAFSEEVEWRCVTVEQPRGVLGGERQILDRPAGAKVIPYVNFDLSEAEGIYLGIRQLVIGPTADPRAIEHAAFHLMRRVRTRDGFSIASPFQPLRPPP